MTCRSELACKIQSELDKKAKEEYDKHAEPMKKDILEFFAILKNYFFAKTILDLRIIFKTRYESTFGIFGVPFFGNEIIICSYEPNEVEVAWKKLLEKWFFSEHGNFLFEALRAIGLREDVSYRYSDSGWGINREMIYFQLR